MKISFSYNILINFISLKKRSKLRPLRSTPLSKLNVTFLRVSLNFNLRFLPFSSSEALFPFWGLFWSLIFVSLYSGISTS